MATSRASKDATLSEMSQRLSKAPMIVIADYRGTTVKDITAFRSSLKKAGLHYEVVKNTIAKRALQGSPRFDVNDVHFGNGRQHFGLLEWVIVQEDERVEPQAQFVGHLAYPLRLWSPIDPVGRDVTPRQQHIRMRAECLLHHGQVVLARDCDQDSAIAQS